MMIHPLSDVMSDNIGQGSQIWQFVVILKHAIIGEDCNICAQCFIENDVCVGDRVTIKNGVYLWDGLRIENDAFIGPNVTFTNDRYPRSRKALEKYPETRIQTGASIGAAVTVLPGLTIGAHSMIGAGSVVTHNVPERSLVMGNPARFIRYLG